SQTPAPSVDHMTRRALAGAEEQRLAPMGIADRRYRRLLLRAQKRRDLPDLVVGQAIGRHRRARDPAADRATQLGIGTAMTPRPGGQIRAAHPATRADAVTIDALLPEQHRAQSDGVRIAGEWIAHIFFRL